MLFVALAFFCALAALYFIGDTSLKKDEEIAVLEVQLANLIADKGQEALPASDARLVKRESLVESEFLEKAETIYGPQELERGQGVLWIDREASRAIITLGRVNGIKEGSRLGVFSEDLRIGEVEVTLALDIISYADPVNMDIGDFGNNYYRIVKEGQ